MLQRAGRPVYARLGVVAGAGVTAAFAVGGMPDPFMLPAFAVVVAVGVILAAPVWQGTASSEATATTLLAVMYIGWLLGYGILLHRSSPRGDDLMLFLVGVTWVGETAAYLVGSTVGHHKLAPVVSPRKTLEGAAAQVVASVLTAMVLRAWLLPSCGARGGGGGRDRARHHRAGGRPRGVRDQAQRRHQGEWRAHPGARGCSRPDR